MCCFGFESLFDRVGGFGAAPETVMDVAAVWGSGDEDAGDLTPASGDGVGAVAHTSAGHGGAASAPDPTMYRPVAFGTATTSTGSAAWPVLVTCVECGTQVRLDAVGYQQVVRRLGAQGWRYVIRPHESAWCPECQPTTGEGGRHRDRARPPLAGSAAREPRRAHPGRVLVPVRAGAPWQRRHDSDIAAPEGGLR